MKYCTVLFALCSVASSVASGAKASGSRPNIVFILSDDLGYGDISISPDVNRTNTIPTPNIEAMAQNGIQFLRGYSGPVCAPSRCTLMTGKHQGHCTIRGNDGAYSPLLNTDVTVAKVLQSAGYHTALVGKWGLGNFGTTGYPLAQGFDEFIGQDSQVACHNWYPYTIQNNTIDNMTIPENQDSSVANCGAHKSKCTWSNDLFADSAVDFIKRSAATSKPFFLYFSTTTPHAGELKGAPNEWPVPGPYDTQFHQYGELLDDFAGAVAAQDAYVGMVMEQLKSSGVYDNTLVVFSGDNGPDHPSFEVFDDTGPFRGKKRSLHEGGVRQDIVAQWPAQIKPSSKSDHLFTFWDVLPTFADAAGVPQSNWPTTDGISALPTMTGESSKQEEHDFLYWEFCYYGSADGLLPQLYGKGWGQSVRWDEGETQWKAIRVNQGPMLLFNLSNDIGEFHNISEAHPDKVQAAITIMNREHVESDFWPSAKGTEKCCASCFNPRGCNAPCKKIPSPPGPPLPPVPLRELAGTWAQGDSIQYNISVDTSSDNVVLHTVHCPGCRWNEAHGKVDNTGNHLIVSASGPHNFNINVTGQIHATGSELEIHWGSHWGPWTRDLGFDFD